MTYKPVPVKLTDSIVSIGNNTKSEAYNGNSFMKGAGNQIGEIGELVLQSVLPEANRAPTKDYDLIFRGCTIDVKTKATTQSRCPPDEYEASVCVHSLHQKPDILAFVRVNRDAGLAWVLGWMPREQFLKDSRYVEAGDIDPNNGFVARQACRSIKHKHLRPIEELIKGDKQ